jgi:hypothetical protein
MVHGQAIGIPFRRRKGEQAPPPPKEVAWNPTIESNLPYKEVKYFKFVEGAGWQALNIGEILPVGQRVLIRIVTTEPYYEVSKAVSSQMTGIQIGKNGVSEYDIVGALTVHSPQILTVTIGVDKNYVQWNPVVESNAEYQVVDFYINTYPAVVGNYYPINSKLGIAVITKGAADEVTSLTVNGVSLGTPSIKGNRFTFNGTLPDKSPQNINIAIDEYIRFEDIVQAYPLFFEFTDENGNLISWGGKAKVGSTITRTKGVAYANLLESLYTVTNPRLNGVPLASAEHVVEKQMVFTCTATWKLSNEPNCILSNQILPIPNSSYKYLGHQPDLSGHGNHGVFNNFEFAGMSGANGYVENFTTWGVYSGIILTDSTIKTNSNFNPANSWVAYKGANTILNSFSVNITGIPEGGILNFRVNTDTFIELSNGRNDLSFDNILITVSSGFRITKGVNLDWSNLVIQQIGEYEGAICFNGVNNCMTIPTLKHGAKQVLLKVNWHLNSNNSGIVYDQRLSSGLLPQNMIISLSADSGNIEERLAYMNEGRADVTYIDGVLNKNITVAQLQGITHNITQCNSAVTVSNSHSPVLGALAINQTLLKYCAQMALFAFMSFPEISPEEEIKDLNDIVGIAGGYVEKPEYYWDCFGKTNDDPDRDAITEQVSKDVANALSVKNADFKLDSGFGKYEVDFLDTSIWNSSNSTITSSKIDCKNAISHIMLLYYNVGNKEYPDIPSFKIIKTGADIDYSYIDETGFPRSVRIVDGVNVLPASHNTLYSGSGRFCGFGNPGIGNSVTITQIPEYQNGFVFNGKTAYLENLNILAITDFTAIAKRVWANKDNPMNECFIHKGVVSTPISESAFMLEYEITNDTYYRSASFGGYINVERVNRPENITYQTTESYNGIPIIKGSGIDTKGLVIGAVTNNYWKGIFYKLMLYSKTIDMLSINALKNLFALDILIDINHPIFKK